jgi:long-chain acyl-CoA synthetase
MTIRTLLDEAVAKRPKSMALRYCKNRTWQSRTYSGLAEGVGQMAEAFGRRLGLKPGEDLIAIILDNGPEWIETYLATAGSGLTVVPLDPKLRPEEIAFVLRDSGAVAVVTDDRHVELLETVLPDLDAVRVVVCVSEGGALPLSVAGRPCYDYEGLRADIGSGTTAWFAENRPAPQSIASVIYTSGTTGKPKGAMLTHHNFCSDAVGGLDLIADAITHRDSFFVVLPLFHAFSFTANFVIPLARGSSMCFVESLRTVGDDIKTLRPTIMMAVPLLAEKLFGKIDEKLQQSRFAQVLLRIGLGRLVGRRVLKGLGGRLRFMFVGARRVRCMCCRDSGGWGPDY